MERHLVALAGDWALWRDFAVRSAGFPVDGLDVFGVEDESTRLAEVAVDSAFGEAVSWQNRSAYRTAVAKIAGRGAEPGSKRRQRDGVVAGYWQRYCAKNDTVGFFGPLAWGTIRDEGPAVALRSRGLVDRARGALRELVPGGAGTGGRSVTGCAAQPTAGARAAPSARGAGEREWPARTRPPRGGTRESRRGAG